MEFRRFQLLKGGYKIINMDVEGGLGAILNDEEMSIAKHILTQRDGVRYQFLRTSQKELHFRKYEDNKLREIGVIYHGVVYTNNHMKDI